MIATQRTFKHEIRGAALADLPPYLGTRVGSDDIVGTGPDSTLMADRALEAQAHSAETYSGFLQIEFAHLAAWWRADNENISSATQLAEHPAYRRIIGLGLDAVPLILRELERRPDHWFTALTEITGQNPVPAGDRGRTARMAQAWLTWGRRVGVI